MEYMIFVWVIGALFTAGAYRYIYRESFIPAVVLGCMGSWPFVLGQIYAASLLGGK